MGDTQQMAGPGTSLILTPDQRPRVFVSSTLQELSTERAAVRAAIEALRLIPVMFELGARPHPARALYRAYLAQSHVFIGVYSERYGWVAPGEEISGLEDEYRLSGGLPRLVYLKTPAPGREADLDALLDRIRDDDTVAYKAFSSADELERLVQDDLAVLMGERFLTPAVSDAASGPGPAPARAPTNPVPRPLSSLVGREAEVTALVDLLDSGARLVSVVGPGGIGKTRVAIEAAHRVSARPSGEVSFVPLEGVADPDAVLPQVAASVGLGLDGGVPVLDALAAVFTDRPILLVMDNVEQVQAAAPDIARLLVACPRVSVLVTSRAPLKVRGEQVVPLGPLGLPAAGDAIQATESAAVRLFVDRAGSARSDFTLEHPGDVDAVAEICRRLDGIPLALELAAARSALLSPRAMLDRIGTALDLSAGAADLPARQRTMRDTLAWSHQLLSRFQSELLGRLSVFVAPWTLTDAEAVADPASGDVMDGLAGLVENSLAVPAADARGEPRFRLYETVRAYAVDLLGEEARAQVESAYVAHLAREAGELALGILSGDHQRWAEEFRLVWPDLRRAWELAVQRDDAERTALASMSLLPLWLEGRDLAAADLLEPSLRLADTQRPPHHGDLVFLCAQSMFSLGDYERAAELLHRIDQDIPPPVHPSLVGAVSLLRGFVAVGSADLEAAERELHRAVRQLESVPDTTADWVEAFVHNGLGSLYAVRGDVETAIGEFILSRTRGRDSGNVSAQMQALVFEADLHLTAGSPDRVQGLLDSACDLLEVRPLFEGNAYCLEVVAAYAAGRGDATAAARLLGLAAALRDALGAHIWTLRQTRSAAIEALVRSASEPGEFDTAFAEGRSLDPRSGAALCRAALLVPAADAGP